MSDILGLLGSLDGAWPHPAVGLANLAERDPAALRQKVPTAYGERLKHGLTFRLTLARPSRP
jgi:hypothetical protein